ncbi:MAG: ATP-binding protein, partial [Tannerellaceae bacterium]
RHRISLIGNMLESYLRTGKNDDAEKYILHGLSLLNEQEMVNTRTGSLFPINRYRCMFYSFYSHIHINRHQLDKADFTLKKAALYRAKNTEPNSNYMNFIYNCASAYYYKATGDYASAMLVIDGLLKENHTHEALQFKVDLLLAQGKYKEAVPLYKEIITLTSKCNNDAFNRQINQLRTIHDLNNKEIQERELKISQMQLMAGRRWLVFSMSFSAVLLCLLYILYLYFKRTHRLKNELLREKDSLLESEKQLRLAKEHAEEASLIKSNFIANISHEIRTPLNAIVGFSGLLTDPSVEEEDKASFSTIINNNTDLLLNLINDVLDLSRLESSNMKFNIKQCDLIICCRCALDSIRHRVSAGVELFFTPPSPSLMLLTDSLRLQQLLINLLTNAAKFTEHGSITLSIEVDEEKRQVRLMVTDTGCGVPPAMQSIIFGRFEKLDEYVQGTGLGLSICQVIADRLEGNLSLDSSYTTGARFIFIHPYNQAE